MPETVYYVDTGVSGGAGDGSSWDNAYSSLNTAENAREADISGGDAVVFRCRASTGVADGVAAISGGWVTDADSYVKVYCDAADSGGRHAGVWDTSKYRIEGSNGNVFTVAEDYVWLEGLQVQKTASSGNFQVPFYVSGLNASNHTRVGNCLFWGDDNNSYTQAGAYLNSANSVLTVWNSLFYCAGGSNSNFSCGVLANAGVTFNFYSCLMVGAYYGIRIGSGRTVTAKNCYFHGGTATASLDSGATLTTTTCASSDTAVDVDNVPHSTTTFQNVTEGSQDYRLASGSALIGAGTTLTDDPPGSTALGADIAGTTRS